MRVVVAIPTIAARPGLAEKTGERWIAATPDADVTVLISTAGSSWGDGLNDIYDRVRIDPPDLFICGSDDMIPAADQWLPAIVPFLENDCFPVPRVSDPRFENYGGPNHPQQEVSDGCPTYMSTFPILKREWLPLVFPVPEGLHYFCDNWISAALWLRGVHAVAVPSCRILHLHAREGRGAGYGSENNRLYIDTVRYSRFLESKGIDRLSLPDPIRGHMHEERYQRVGREMGA